MWVLQTIKVFGVYVTPQNKSMFAHILGIYLNASLLADDGRDDCPAFHTFRAAKLDFNCLRLLCVVGAIWMPRCLQNHF